MNLDNRIKKLETYIGDNIEDNATYTLDVGVEEPKWTKTIDGVTVPITQAEYSKAVDKIIQRGQCINEIEPNFNIKIVD